MMPLCWAVLLLCLSANAEDVALYKELGESVTLKCSSEGCPSSIEGYTGMYLYLHFKRWLEEVLYCFNEGSKETISIRDFFKDRTQAEGSLKNRTITISNLTVEDAGSYQCVYTHIFKDKVICKAHTLVVRGSTDAVSASAAPSRRRLIRNDPALLPAKEGLPCVNERTSEKSTPPVSFIMATCAISTLATVTLILFVLRVKQWTRSRKTEKTPQVLEDSVYEAMSTNGLRPEAAPENSPVNSYDLD